MKQRVFWKVISATLSVVMLLQAATFVAFSETSEPTDQIGTAEAEPVLVGEITEKRTENEKYFLYSDNSVVAAVYPDAVHYEDAGGNMQAIDNRLIDTTDGSDAYAQNTANLWNIKFAKKAKDGKLAKLKYKTHNISWYLQGAEKTEGTPVAATESIGEEAHAVYGTSSGMRYSDILKDTDLEYLLIGTEIKENIILHTADAVTDYTFVYDVGALTMELRDNTLCLQDGEETVLFLSAPVMQDAAMEYNYDITLSLVPLKENNGKHVYAVTVSPNKEWALSQERVFPITIDPTLTTEQDKNHIVDTYVDSSEPTITHHNATTLKVGMNTTSKLYRIFLKFDLPELLGAHDRVVSAYLNLHPNTTAADLATMAQKAPAILIYEPLADWDATTLTWNNQPWNQTATYNSTAKDYDMVGAKGSQSAYRWYQWDITDTVDKWYTTGNNKGLMLKYYDESSLGSNMVVNYVSTQTAVSNAAFPVVTFRYINMLGLEDYWTYQTLDNGIAGTAYINNFTGGLTTITPLASVASELMPINVSLIYSPDSVNRSINSLSPGKGFMLNLQACITPITIGGTEKYKYTDADGTVHYFEETDKGWVDEDGLGLKLTIGTTHYEITDKQDGKLCFYVDTGRLSQIVDSTGNLLQLYYEPVTASGSTKYYLREIKEIQTGASVTFVRDDVNLHKIIYPDENGTMRHVLFTYTANGDVYHVTQYVLENGSTESYAPTDVISYVASNGVLTEVGGYPYDPSNPPGQSGSVLSGTALVFGYNATGTDALRRRVTSYKLCAYTETEGYTTANIQGTSEYEITVSYGTRSTKYTKAIPNSFTQTELYTFNTYGQTITAQDFDGNAKFQSQGISGGEKNKVTFASNTQRSFINLLKNHNFEKNTGEALPDWPKYGGTGDNAALRGTADGVPTYIGAKAMKVYKGNATQATHSTVKQTVSLTAGKIYTLSAYVYTEIETLDTTNSKAGAFFGVENSDYSIQVYKNAISSASGYTRYFLTVDLTNITTTQNYSVFFGVRNARGAAFFDCVQLEEGNLVNSYNMIENGAFTNTADTVSWTGTGLATTDTIQATSGRNGTPGYRLHGTPSVAKEIHQSIPIAGSAGSSFTAGVWLKGYSLPHRSAETGENVRSCAIKLELKSASGQKQTVTEIIESGLAEWRYICLGAIANFAFTEITLYLTYPYNCNNVTFDEVNLFMDKFGQSFTYDANGNVTSVVDLANNTKNIVTNGNNDMTSYTDGNGNQYRFEYDGGSTTAKKHLLTKVTNPDSSTLSNVYNSFGRVTKSTVSGGGLTMNSSVEYTTNGRFVQSETDAAGVKTEYDRDTGTGRVYQVQSSANMVKNGEQVQDTTLLTQYDYDAKTKQLTDVSLYHTESLGYFETVELSPKVSYGYYKGRMTDLLRKSGTGTDVTKQMGYHFTYDAFGKTTAVHWSGKNNTEYLLQNTAYHGWMGVPGTVTYGNGQYVQYHYNRAGQMYRKLANGTAVAKFNYNANNNLGSSAYLRSDNQTFVTTHYFYDLAGRIKETASSLGFTTDKYLFDKNNNVTQYRTGLSDGKVNLAYYTNFTYDNMNALKKLVLCPSGGYGSGTMNFTYDGLHRLKKKDVTLDANTNLAEVYTYEKNGDGSETGRLASVSLSGNFGGNSVSLGYSNTYTANGMIASQTATKNGTPQVTNYSYDELGQLVKETRPGETYTYTYDGGGNILSQSKTTSSGVTSSAYTYDSNMTDLLTKFTTTLPNGTTTSKEYTYNQDAAGNFSFVNPLTIKKSTNGTVTDTWNLGWREGRVLQSIASSAGTVQYEYNENGLRTYKKLANGEKEEYYYNGSQLTVLKHLTAAGNLTYALHFIYDSNGQMQYILYNAPANASNAKIYELYYIVRDLTGAITKLIKTRTGTSTSITPVLQLAAEYSYDPYGKLLGVTTYNGNNIGNINPIRYKDYFYDTETSWYYLTSRYYDPEVGRFLNGDSEINQDIYGSNVFAYCGNNPINRIDSDGKGWWILVGAAIGGIVGGTTQIVANIASGDKWNNDLLGATLGGAVTGAITAATGGFGWAVAAAIGGTATSVVINEVSEYVPALAKLNGKTTTKEASYENIVKSVQTSTVNVAIGSATSLATGAVIEKLLPLNNLIKPEKLTTCLSGNYSSRFTGQTIMQASLDFFVNNFRQHGNQTLPRGQQSIKCLYPSVSITARR